MRRLNVPTGRGNDIEFRGACDPLQRRRIAPHPREVTIDKRLATGKSVLASLICSEVEIVLYQVVLEQHGVASNQTEIPQIDAALAEAPKHSRVRRTKPTHDVDRQVNVRHGF